MTPVEWMVQEVALAWMKMRSAVTGTGDDDNMSGKESPVYTCLPCPFSLSLFAPLKERVACAMGSQRFTFH
jgi:hypothetical protein